MPFAPHLPKREKRDAEEQREKKEKRVYKKELRKLFGEELPKLEKKQRDKLIETVAQLYMRVGYRNSAARFAQRLIEGIKLLPKKKRG